MRKPEPITSDHQPTQQFLDDVQMLIFDASQLGRHAKAELGAIAGYITRREIEQLSFVSADEIKLSDEEWAKLARKARVLAGGPSDQW